MNQNAATFADELRARFPGCEVFVAEPRGEITLQVPAGGWRDVARTLRDAGITQDDVLYLRGRPTFAAPTLYDDVVDAAARLNQSGHAGWDPAGARRIAYLGIGLAITLLMLLVGLLLILMDWRRSRSSLGPLNDDHPVGQASLDREPEPGAGQHSLHLRE